MKLERVKQKRDNTTQQPHPRTTIHNPLGLRAKAVKPPQQSALCPSLMEQDLISIPITTVVS